MDLKPLKNDLHRSLPEEGSKCCYLCGKRWRCDRFILFVYADYDGNVVSSAFLKKRGFLENDIGWIKLHADCANKVGLIYEDWTFGAPVVELHDKSDLDDFNAIDIRFDVRPDFDKDAVFVEVSEHNRTLVITGTFTSDGFAENITDALRCVYLKARNDEREA